MSRLTASASLFSVAPRRRALAWTLLAGACVLGVGASAWAQSKGEIRIAHIRSITGPLEAYGKQTSTGFLMGLD